MAERVGFEPVVPLNLRKLFILPAARIAKTAWFELKRLSKSSIISLTTLDTGFKVADSHTRIAIFTVKRWQRYHVAPET